MVIHSLEYIRKIVGLHGVGKQEVVYPDLCMIFIHQMFLLSINRFVDDDYHLHAVLGVLKLRRYQRFTNGLVCQ